MSVKSIDKWLVISLRQKKIFIKSSNIIFCHMSILLNYIETKSYKYLFLNLKFLTYISMNFTQEFNKYIYLTDMTKH